MTPADRYRKLAADLLVRAQREESLHLAAEWGNLSRCYVRLAEQADLTDNLDMAYHPILQD